MNNIEKIDFNLNTHVWVQLTDRGRKRMKEKHKEDEIFVKRKLATCFPEEDENGWSRWQMHCLMETFGSITGIGMRHPFNINIKIEIGR